jgi:hypothetical protein
MPDRAIVAEIVSASAALRAEVQELSGKVEDLVTSTDELTKNDARNRHGIVALAAAGIVMLAVVAAVVVALIRVDRAADKAQSVQDYQRSTCETGNETRAQQAKLWDFILAAATPESAKEKAQVAELDRLVARTFAQRDCAALIENPPTPRP